MVFKIINILQIRVLFKKQNMFLKRYGKSILKRALEMTKYREILPLFDAPHILVFSSEVQLAAMLKICRRAKQFVLLCKCTYLIIHTV